MKKDNLYHHESMWKGAPNESFSKARELREKMTLAETILWRRLKTKQLLGYKFRRQHPIHIYIVDFYCHSLNLVIELDGKYHEQEEQKLKDIERTKYLEYQGVHVFRFVNEEVLNNLEEVINNIKQIIQNLES